MLAALLLCVLWVDTFGLLMLRRQVKELRERLNLLGPVAKPVDKPVGVDG